MSSSASDPTILLSEIERLRAALQAIRDTPRSAGILACQRIASDALIGRDTNQPLDESLGAPDYYLEVIQYLRWKWQSRCAYCTAAGAEQIDHLTPVSRGGSDAIGNLVLACARCNSVKAAQTVEEFGYPDLRLTAIAQVLDGWRKVAERHRRESERIQQIVRSEEQPF